MAGFFIFALAACTEFDLIQFQDVRPIESLRDYSKHDCAQLAAEKHRVEAAFKPYVGGFRPGTRRAVATLKGDAIAVDARSHELGCHNAPVVIPYNKPRGSQVP